MYKNLYKRLSEEMKMHLGFWTAYILFEVTVTLLISDRLAVLHYALFYSINVGIFYAHSFYLLKRFNRSNPGAFIKLILFILLEVTIYCSLAFAISFLLNVFIYRESNPLSFYSSKYFPLTIYRGAIFIMYGTGYYVAKSYINRKEKIHYQNIENERLKNKLLQSEQDFLRAQINPHLLFNTLSFIKYAAKRKPEEADEAVMRLSDIMSFALENNTEMIDIADELEQVENIIALNQLRFNHALNVQYTRKIHNTEARIIPIVILTLVENVFKHGNLITEEFPAMIMVETTENYIMVATSNLPNRGLNLLSNKTGLANISSRLEQYYKGNYYFEYGIKENYFNVTLKILLNKAQSVPVSSIFIS